MSLLLCLSTLLIFNSHIESYYPRSWMAGDGLLGNTMFFVLSGYGVQSSFNTKVSSFRPYLWRRFIRIYPPLFLTLLTIGFPKLILIARDRPLKLFCELIWPTAFTYIAIIVPFYILLYVVGHKRSKRAITLAACICFSLFIILAALDAHTITPGLHLSLGVRPIPVHVAFYASAIFMGAWMACAPLRPAVTLSRIMILCIVLATYFFMKYEMVARGNFSQVYPLLHILVQYACALSLITLGSTATMDSFPPWIRRILRQGSLLSLEVYLTHEFVLCRPMFLSLALPINIIALLAVTVSIAEIIRRIAVIIRHRLEQMFVTAK